MAGVVFAIASIAGTILFTGGMGFAIGRGIDGKPIRDVIVVAILGLVLRVVAGFAIDWSATTAGARVKSQLRDRVLGCLTPASIERHTPATVTTLLGHGIDALDPYFAHYLPQLIATAVITPITVVALWWIDPLSGLAVTVTLPLIPFFMVLIGWATSATQAKQWSMLVSLSNGFLDVVNGLSTLQLFGRANRQIEQVRTMTDDYRVRTMSVLRMSFLSGFALEIGASLSVAVVAVSIGLRLVDGSMTLEIGLWALLLAPEAFLALRRVGALFHASAEGIEAAAGIFELAENQQLRATPPGDRVPNADAVLTVTELVIPGRGTPVSFTACRGEVVALTGPSGSGKSSAIDAIRGATPHSGLATISGATVSARDVAWSPQNHALVPGSVLDNVTMGADIEWTELDQALTLAHVDLALNETVGGAGSATSGGQAARIALARAIYRAVTKQTPILLLDEPTASLDDENERGVATSIRSLADDGFIVVCTSHRSAITEIADRVVRVGS